MRILYRLLILSLFSTFSCGSPDYLTAEELNTFIKENGNGLVKTVDINNYRIDVTYKPTDLWVYQEVGDEPATREQLEVFRNKYSPYYYFIVSLSKNNKEALHQVDGGMSQYSELVNTLSFRMSEYTTLTTSGQDTIPVGDFMLNRTYGLSASTDLLFVFSREKSDNDEWIQFNLNEFGLGIGNQRFRFRKKDLDNTPKIRFETL